MDFPSDTKNNIKTPWNDVKTHRKISSLIIFLFNHKRTLSKLAENVKFKVVFKLY